jgi:polygalacturonase
LKFGAKTDGITNSGKAFAEAISAASEKGGGIVYFPKGDYMTGPIHLKSNVTLNISVGAIIKFSDNFDDYLPMISSRNGGINLKNFSPLIYSNGADNIRIIGGGILDGSGDKWWTFNKELSDKHKKTGVWPTNKWQKEFFDLNNMTELIEEQKSYESGFFRPNFIQLMNGKNILIQDITVRNSPAWNLNPVYCDNVIIKDVHIENPNNSPNTDGIDPDSSRNVLISNCTISVGDDCLVIKSGLGVQGRHINRPSENIVVTDCLMRSGHGGIVIGSEMSGGVRNVTVSNCVFEGTDNGVRIKSSRGRGGIVKDIKISDIVMKNILRIGITINMFYTKSAFEPFSERTPQFRDIILRNISGTAKQAIEMIGLSESPLTNVSLIDINIKAHEGINVIDVKDIQYKNVTIISN